MKCESLSRTLAASLVVAVSMIGGAATSDASVWITADAPYPASPEVFTVDPEGRGMPASAGRGVAADRKLRQTFQNPVTFDVRGIVLSQDVDNRDGGYVMSVYEVDDVNASTLAVGNLLTTITIPAGVGSLPGTSQNRLGFSLFGSDVFTLPARGTTADTLGYAFEISNADDTTTIGTVRHTNFTDTDGNLVDYYAEGKFYTESGGQSGGGHRDIGLALFSGPIAPEPTTALLLVVGGLLGAGRRRRS
jgi:hypothetical protein